MFNLNNFIEDCKEAVKTDDPQGKVGKLMEEAFLDPEAVLQALHDAGPKKDVKPLYADENLTVLRVFTPANFISPIHNHLMWVKIGILEGEEKNYLYRRTADGGVEVEQEVVLKPSTGIFTLRADAIHAIEMPPNQAMCALHVYGGNILERSSRSAWDPETMEEVPYNYAQLIDFCKFLGAQRKAG
jgi:predicted metal-dependent enzyme (double-stranded beta helix superfamily)